MVKNTTTKNTYKELVECAEELPDEGHYESSLSNQRPRNMPSPKSGEEAKLDPKALSLRFRKTGAQREEEAVPEDDEARCTRTTLLRRSPDDDKEEIANRVKTEQELVADAWAAFDAAVAEDPSLMPKPGSIFVDDSKTRMPQSTKRKRDLTEDLAELTIDGARYVIKLDVSFDASNLSKYWRERNLHYEIYAQDARTIKNLLDTLWDENHEWLVHEGYSLERVRQVERLEIALPIEEGTSLENTQCWSIRGDFEGQEQSEAWTQFLEAAKARGRGEASDQLRKMEKEERGKRRRYVRDHLGNYYKPNGEYWKPKKQLVHAHVDARIVLYFD
jgi:hypothetical protein